MLPDAVTEGARLFNAGRYFEAHEAWEEHWGLGGPAERALVLGLVKAAVALEHLRNGNARGFQWQLEKALPLLRENAGVWPGLDVLALADGLESVGARFRFHGEIPEAEFPRLTMEGGSAAGGAPDGRPGDP